MTAVVMNIEDAAAYLGTTTDHVRGLVYRKRIPHTKVGKYLAFRAAELDAWLVDHNVELRER